jgi:hypothetical protein
MEFGQFLLIIWAIFADNFQKNGPKTIFHNFESYYTQICLLLDHKQNKKHNI